MITKLETKQENTNYEHKNHHRGTTVEKIIVDKDENT